MATPLSLQHGRSPGGLTRRKPARKYLAPRPLTGNPGEQSEYAAFHQNAFDYTLERKLGYETLSERTLRVSAPGRNAWSVIGSEVRETTVAVPNSVVETCKHLEIDPFAYPRDSLPGWFALGEKPTTE